MTQGRADPATAQPFARLALVGILLYVAIDVVLGALRPDYSLFTNYESDYGRGPFAWLMDVNFLLRGVLSGLAALALHRAGIASRWSAALVWVWAVASALLAVFPDNPVGYPREASGGIHLLLAAIAFVSIAVATMGISFSRPRHIADLVSLRVLSAAGVIGLVLVVHPFGIPGLVERAFLATEFAWLAVALSAVSRQRR